jgi:hypothetical protein
VLSQNIGFALLGADPPPKQPDYNSGRRIVSEINSKAEKARGPKDEGSEVQIQLTKCEEGRVERNLKGNDLISEISYTPLKELKLSICKDARASRIEVLHILARASYQNSDYLGFLSPYKTWDITLNKP